MRKKSNNIEIESLFRGMKVDAIYKKTRVPHYNGNPLVEALPPILPLEQAISELSYLPPVEPAWREEPDHTRMHILQSSMRIFSPLDAHLDLERRFSLLLRAGYLERNPLSLEYWREMKKGVESFSQYGKSPDFRSTRHPGFNFIGISGSGKTQSVQRILNLYPQVIRHSSYNNSAFTNQQLVWLKLDCPFDGSIKGLCLNFFAAVDDLFGTTYLEDHGHGTTDKMIPFIANVAANHFLGVLVVDEIQRLKLQKSGGADRMLNFFTQLINTIGVPVVLVGTTKALSILGNDISQPRRGTGQGDLIWDRMSNDKQWNSFVKSLWKYQHTRIPCSLEKEPELADTLYYETQGIVDLAIKAFMFAQERAIDTGVEKITCSIIRSVAYDKFKILRPALKALKTKEKGAEELYEDIYPVFREGYSDKNPPPTIIGEAARFPEIKEQPHIGIETVQEKLKNENPEIGVFSPADPALNKNKIAKDKKTPSVLANIFKEGLENGKSIYERLATAGFIRSGDEFIREVV